MLAICGGEDFQVLVVHSRRLVLRLSGSVRGSSDEGALLAAAGWDATSPEAGHRASVAGSRDEL